MEEKIIGKAWIDNVCRPIYYIKKIKKGFNKNKFEVRYRKSISYFKKAVIAESGIYELYIDFDS